MIALPSARSLSALFDRLRFGGLAFSWLAMTGATCDARATPPESAVPDHASTSGMDAAILAPPEALRALRIAMMREPGEDVRLRAQSQADALRASRPSEAALYDWVAAEADTDVRRGAERLAQIAESESPLAPWAALAAARRRMEDDPARAHALLAIARRAPASWPGHLEANAIDALAVARSGQPDAETMLRAAIAAPPNVAVDRTLRRALADILATRSEAALRREALGLYLDLLAEAPASEAAEAAEARVTTLAETFPEEERAQLIAPTLSQQRARAARLEGLQQHRSASEAHADIATHFEAGTAERCAALLDAGRVLHRGRVHAEAITRLETMIAECETPEAITDPARRDGLVWAHYSLGRSALSAGQVPLAISHLSHVPEIDGTHRLADDAYVYVGRMRLERGERVLAEQAFDAAAEVHGDMESEARFLVAWDHRAHGELSEALAALDANVARGSIETTEGMVGRTEYWRARLLETLSREDESADAYEALFRAHPLTYYAQLALARLAARDEARALRTRTSALPARPDVNGVDLQRAELDVLARGIDTTDEARAFERATSLLAVGQVQWAERELSALGIGPDSEIETVVAMTALFTAHGHANRATVLARRRLAEVLLAPPNATSFALFRAAYPQAFEGLIEDAAIEASVDPAFVRAVAREESSFDPDAVSVSHAYGLLQLIRPTAQRYARPMGLSSEPESLTRPAVNVRIGARYMGALQRRYSGEAALIPPAYNAGEGAVDRWIRERPEQSFDAWVEEIPYAETRGYTRRVLQSWSIYAFLDAGELPTFPTDLPRRDG
jgi:soluble lytic murein transglycosylase